MSENLVHLLERRDRIVEGDVLVLFGVRQCVIAAETDELFRAGKVRVFFGASLLNDLPSEDRATRKQSRNQEPTVHLQSLADQGWRVQLPKSESHRIMAAAD